MNRETVVQIKVDWAQETPFRVTFSRTIPTARRLPEPFIEPFYIAEEEAWSATTGFFF